jgi:hypothetical protein
MTIPGSNQGEGSGDLLAQLSKSLQESHAPETPLTSRLQVSKPNRPASKSISSVPRPSLNLFKRTQSYHNSKSPYSSSAGAGPSSPSPNLLPSPSYTPGQNVMKRRTSTPSLAKQYLPEDEEAELPPLVLEPSPTSSAKGKEKAIESRARSTSTSFVYPPSLLAPSPTVAVLKKSPFRGTVNIPPPQWTGLQVTPASPEELEDSWRPEPIVPKPTFITKAKDFSETSLARFAQWVKPSKRRKVERRRISEDDSEKGMSEEDGGDHAESLESVGTTRTSVDSSRAGHRQGRYWGLSDEDEDPGYFSLPPTPPEEKDSITFDLASFGQGASLPTPALSTRSLSRPRTSRRPPQTRQEDSSRGWLRHLLSYGSGTKTGQVIRELGWTVGLLAALFLITGGVALYMIKGMPM